MNRLLTRLSLLTLLTISSSTLLADSLCKGYQSPLFGDKVCVFDPAQSHGSIQDVVTGIHNHEINNEFGGDGYALLFQQGNYDNTILPNGVPVGYYTQVLGLGISPADTTINNVNVSIDDIKSQGGTSLDLFWRGAENFTAPGDMIWAVSQASPLRNVHVTGVLVLALGEQFYASGGFMANSQADGGIAQNGQQQWITRNSSMKAWYAGVWNAVFVGDKNDTPISPGNPTSRTWDNYPYTVVDKTPRVQEKPYLAYDNDNKQFEVIVPSYKTDSIGPNWSGGTIISQNQFIVVTPGMTADQINSSLHADNNTKAIIFTPGQYNFNSTIKIDRDKTVVLGLGVPVLTATKSNTPIMVTSASGVKIGGLLFEAGSNDVIHDNDASLLQIGDGQGTSVETSPTLLSDIYCRVGGRIAAETNSCLTINDDYVIGDNLWLWRADHGLGAGTWDGDQANHGLIVNGSHVTMYGLAVEHFQKNQVQWFGDNGSLYFYQSELPYDLPKDSTGKYVDNYVVPASFKVEDSVTHFSGYGLGIYDFFRTAGANPSSLSAIETPGASDINFTHMVTVTLGANSLGTTHIANVILKMMPQSQQPIAFAGDLHTNPQTPQKTFGYWDMHTQPTPTAR